MRIAIVVVVLAVAWIGVRGLLAQRHLTAAKADLAAAKEALLGRELADADRLIGDAGKETSAARGLTTDPLWRAAGHVPLLGATLAEAADVARGADVVARTVLPPAFAAARELDPKALRAADGTIDVAVLRQAQPAVDQATAAGVAALAGLADAPRRGVLWPVSEAADDLRTQARDLADALRGVQRGLRIAPALLGADRPRRYFVLIQQNSEARGTGGLPGGFAILTADKGRLRVTNQGSNADLQDGELPPPPGVPADYVQRYRGDGVFDRWVNVNLSPDLPVVARVIADRWRHQAGQRVDGVITVDSQALRDILRGSPPIPVPGAAPLTPANIVDYLAIGQYRDFAAPDGSSSGVDRSAERKQLLETIARAATSRLVNGGGSTLELMRGIADAVGSGHLRMGSDDPALAPGLREAGIDGALPSGPGPVAYAVLFNSSGGKLEYFLDRSIRYEAGACTGARRKSSITVELTNRAPDGLPAYLYNPYHLPGITGTGNRVTVTVYATRGAKLTKAVIDGKPLGTQDGAAGYLNAFTEAGLPAWSTRVDLPSGPTRRLVLTLDEPVSPGAARVPEQPLPRALARRVEVPTC
ncbi:MAG: DUF4012 domain-containing protein [Frankiaceae bacterium]|nr:DUF4012 domain-containing protein [Frankiaceae bacterium]